MDYCINLLDAFTYCSYKISILASIYIDPINISKDPIKFIGSREYGGYNVISSFNERTRRIIHWFYRNITAPTIIDWEQYIKQFNLKEIPTHVLQLYDLNKEPLEKFIVIHNITKNFIHYTYEDRTMNCSTNKTVIVPMGIASLVPERLLFNLNMYYTE